MTNWSKTIIVSSGLLLFVNIFSLAQPVRKISLWGKKVVPLLLAFDSECVRDGYKVDGSMGVYKIIRYATMRDSLEHWYVSLILDDQYKDQLPKEYAQLTDEIFFFYDSDEKGTVTLNHTNSEVLSYLDSIVADRLYIRPAKKQQWAEFQVNGEIIREEVQKDVSGGYPRNSIWFTFQKEGSIKTSCPFRQ